MIDVGRKTVLQRQRRRIEKGGFMKQALRILLVSLALLTAACAGLASIGREFPSPSAEMIRAGQTSKPDLLRMFGEPTEVGLDTGDQTWSWLYAQFTGEQRRKQLTVRFDDRGIVKSYSFNSSFSEDMKRLK